MPSHSEEARDLAFCLKVPLDPQLVWASSEGSGETARMRRLAWTFAARIGDKYQIRLTRSIYKTWSSCFGWRWLKPGFWIFNMQHILQSVSSIQVCTLALVNLDIKYVHQKVVFFKFIIWQIYSSFVLE